MKKLIRKIITIDESKCDGCGLCIPSCEEGALQIVDGKARLVKDIYCDGLGNCLGECPQGAIEMIEREAEPFDEKAVEEHLERLEKEQAKQGTEKTPTCGVCCGPSQERDSAQTLTSSVAAEGGKASVEEAPEAELSHWPVQLHLVSPRARFLQGVNLLIAADCVPFAYADFHRRFLIDHSLVIGCPKLDDVDAYHGKLVEIFKNNSLQSITLAHMEVGCCFGLSRLVHSALEESGAQIPLTEVIVGIDGRIKSE